MTTSFEELSLEEQLAITYADRCRARGGEGQEHLICLKSKEHVNSSNPQRAAHYDIDAEVYWGYPGKIEIEIVVPGSESPFTQQVGLPETWAEMSDEQRQSHLNWLQEDTKDNIEVLAYYDRNA